ncbi:MAG: gas vesicle synthesis protein GvpA [Acidobacteria bacterium]|nr:MAG: gas vesicle synthesis protein GvpA [Acidobacteriota bacterium]
MTIERTSISSPSYADVIDRVLDKGIVIEARVRMSVAGIDLMTVEAHFIVASLETYLQHWPNMDGASSMAGRRLILE